jgi:L-lactate dehydrogenase (cytochrome)
VKDWLTVEDLRATARRRVPGFLFDYIESGSWAEQTLASNRAAFAGWNLRQKVAVDVETRDLRATVLGQARPLPFGLSPVGMLGLFHADGEIAAARAAAAFGIPFVLSTMSICSIEDVARLAAAPFWFQLYVMRDRGFTHSLMDRAAAAGCDTLVLTLDLQIMGQRHRDRRNRLGASPMTPRQMFEVATRPRWALGMARTPRRGFGNITGHVAGLDAHASLAEWTARQFDPSLDWEDVKALRDRWSGKLVLKGILDVEDAEKAASCGADAVVVSNHGGRQLDGAQAALDALPAIAGHVGDRLEVFFDGGVRSGQDAVKALCMGARAVFVGRPMAYGVGAGGQCGVERMIEILRDELDLSMSLMGRTSVAGLGRTALLPRSASPLSAAAHPHQG